MDSTRVLVVSDTHLSSRTPEAVANWGAVVDHVATGDHDLVVHVGDITVDGAARDDDIAVARAELARLGTRLRAVPGNHDLGDNPFPGPSELDAPDAPSPDDDSAHGSADDLDLAGQDVADDPGDPDDLAQVDGRAADPAHDDGHDDPAHAFDSAHRSHDDPDPAAAAANDGPAAADPVAGDPGHERPVSPERLGRYRAGLGPDRWVLDLPGWRVVGLNSLLFGSGLDAEAEQWEWLAGTLAAGEDRRLALVLHKPLEAPPGASAAPHRYVPPDSATRLRALLDGAGSDLGLVVSGHVHQHARYDRDGVTYLWAPTTWAVLPDRVQAVLGDKACGVVELVLHADGTLDATLTRPRSLTHHVLFDTIPSPY